MWPHPACIGYLHAHAAPMPRHAVFLAPAALSENTSMCEDLLLEVMILVCSWAQG